MPTYEYACAAGHQWDVIKRVANIDDVEMCATCGTLGDRQISRVNFNGAADWNTQTFNPALGCYTRNTRHARQIAKAKGFEEIGNEKPETIHKHFEKQKEETRAQRWEDAMKDKVYGD